MPNISNHGPDFYPRPLPPAPEKTPLSPAKSKPELPPRPLHLYMGRNIRAGEVANAKLPPPIDRSTKPRSTSLPKIEVLQNEPPKIRDARLQRFEGMHHIEKVVAHRVFVSPATKEYVTTLSSDPKAKSTLMMTYPLLSKSEKAELKQAIQDAAQNNPSLKSLLSTLEAPRPPVTDTPPLFKQEGKSPQEFAKEFIASPAARNEFLLLLTGNELNRLKSIHDPTQLYPLEKTKLGQQMGIEVSQITRYAQIMILTQDTPKEAAKVADFIAKCAADARKQGNEQVAMALFQSLTGAVDRLNLNPPARKANEQISHLLGSPGNYLAHMNSSFAKDPVPFLAHLNNGITNTTGAEGMGIAARATALSISLSQFQGAHEKALRQPPPRSSTLSLSTPPSFSDKDLYDLSLKLRPRGK